MNRTLRRMLAAGAAVLASVSATDLAAQDDIVEIGDFFYASMQDEMSDEDRSMVVTMAEEDGYREPSLVWRCMEDGLNVMYNWDKYFIGNDNSGADIQFRFDQGEVSPTLSWDISTDHSAAFLPTDLVEVFTQAALASGRVVLRVEDSDGERLTDTFGLEGLSQALSRLACARM